MLTLFGHGEDALQAAAEAEEISRQLAQANPVAFTPRMHGTLLRRGQALALRSESEQALCAAVEAVAGYRQLANADPHIHEGDLANALGSLGAQLVGLGQHELAHDAFTEAR